MKVPRRYGVYRLQDSDGRLLYVGASVSPRIRQSVHRSTRPWGKDVDPGRLTVDWYETEAEAAAAELEAIATEAPLHNRHGADWKMIPYRYDRFQPKIRPETMSVEMAIQAIGDSTLEVIADNDERRPACPSRGSGRRGTLTTPGEQPHAAGELLAGLAT